jgi:hypothetical protein
VEHRAREPIADQPHPDHCVSSSRCDRALDAVVNDSAIMRQPPEWKRTKEWA